MSCSRLAFLAAIILLSATTPVPAQSPPGQRDRIEQKLDAILRRLDQIQPATPAAAQPAVPPLPAGVARTPLAPASEAAESAPPPDVLAAGVLAIIHAAPVTVVAAREIPADSVGGMIYTGGPLQLADLKDRGVHYSGLAGVEWQGWLRAPEAGRYQLELDGSTASPNNYTNSTCIFTGWLEDRLIGSREVTPVSNVTGPTPFSLVLGAELQQSGLYKLRLWASCTPSVRNQRVVVELLEKTPADLNFRPVTGEDLVHRQR